MAGVLNFTPSVISRPLSRFRREPNSRVCYVRSSAETPAVTSKEEPPRLGVSSPTTPSFSPPPNFKPPQPKRFFIRPDKLFDILGASLALIFRLGTGVVVSGYSPSFVSKDEISSDQYALEIAGFKVKETSKLGPRPEMPIEIYEFESCPFCRKVREIVAVLDLDVLYYPCPKNGPNFRQKAVQLGGKKQFPYMELFSSKIKVGMLTPFIYISPNDYNIHL